MSTEVTLSVRLDDLLKAKLDALARRTGRSSSDLSAAAIAAYVELNESQIAEIESDLAELGVGQIISEEEAAEQYERLQKPR